MKNFTEIYRAPLGLVNFGSARQSQIKAKRFERRGHSRTMANEENQFGKAAASRNSSNLTERGISS